MFYPIQFDFHTVHFYFKTKVFIQMQKCINKNDYDKADIDIKTESSNLDKNKCITCFRKFSKN